MREEQIHIVIYNQSLVRLNQAKSIMLAKMPNKKKITNDEVISEALKFYINKNMKG